MRLTTRLDAGVADEHVMRFFGQHELAGARERLEPGFGQRRKLILAVAIREHREAEKVEPVVAGLIEGFEDARLVGIAAASFQAKHPLRRAHRVRSNACSR